MLGVMTTLMPPSCKRYTRTFCIVSVAAVAVPRVGCLAQEGVLDEVVADRVASAVVRSRRLCCDHLSEAVVSEDQPNGDTFFIRCQRSLLVALSQADAPCSQQRPFIRAAATVFA